ncbi:MAG: VCBS repeat-containing protein [Myxococcales bacterium]|nr:VCBS repeat-containing protein [Myxococcales bacterium]
MNADGKPDLISANSDSHNLSILLGQGSGRFAGQQVLPVGNFPSDVQIADLDSDGKLDLVVAADGISRVQMYMGFGDGSFFPAKLTLSRAGSGPLAISDQDKDGKPDLLLGHETSGTLGLWLNVTP